MSSILIFSLLLSLLTTPSSSSTVKCHAAGCEVSNYQGLWVDREPCIALAARFPTNEEELVSAVASAVQNNQSIKVVSKLGHSLPKWVCPRGKTGIVISTSKYNSRIIVKKHAKTVTVDAGVELKDLFATLAKRGLTLPVSPSFNGISVAGAISTGSHGSSLHGRGGALHEYVVGISIVVPAKEHEGYAKVVKLSSHREDLNAARLSLGVLGAISTVTFAVEPMFKRSVIKLAKNDSTLEDDILEVAAKYEFGEINWHISQGRTIQTLSKKVSAETPGEGRNINYTPRSGNSVAFFRGVGEQLIASANETAICEISMTSINNRVAGGDGLVSNATKFISYPVVGYNHLMETGGGCQDTQGNNTFTATGDKLTCPWDPELPGHQIFFEAGFAIPLTKIKKVIRDIKKLRDKNPVKMCGLNLYGGTIFRFVRGSKAYLASPADSVYFDMIYYRNRLSNTPMVDEDAIEELQQLLLKKYNARPHWGKNQDFAFENVGAKTTNLAKFIRVMKKMDPQGLFSSEWSDAVLGIRREGISGRTVSTVRDHCALEGLCICSRDSDCAPEKGYLCKKGRLFKPARVCRQQH